MARSRLRSVKRWLATHFIPEALLYPLWRWRKGRKSRLAQPTASDHHALEIQEGIRLEVCWVNHQLGPGPGASLYVLGEEVLRLDCFGTRGLTGHYHINPRQVELHSLEPARIFFPPGSHRDHIERAAFELERNLPAVLAMNRDPRIRRTELSNLRLAQAAKDMRRVMLELLDKHRNGALEVS